MRTLDTPTTMDDMTSNPDETVSAGGIILPGNGIIKNETVIGAMAAELGQQRPEAATQAQVQCPGLISDPDMIMQMAAEAGLEGAQTVVQAEQVQRGVELIKVVGR